MKKVTLYVPTEQYMVDMLLYDISKRIEERVSTEIKTDLENIGIIEEMPDRIRGLVADGTNVYEKFIDVIQELEYQLDRNKRNLLFNSLSLKNAINKFPSSRTDSQISVFVNNPSVTNTNSNENDTVYLDDTGKYFKHFWELKSEIIDVIVTFFKCHFYKIMCREYYYVDIEMNSDLDIY